MSKRTIPLSQTEQGRRRFIKQVLGSSLLLVTVPSLASRRGADTVLMEQHKQEFLEKYSPNGFDPFAHRWSYGIDAYKCIGCNQCMTACKLENGLPGHPSINNRWIERYTKLEGDSTVYVDAATDPANIAVSDPDNYIYRFDDRYENADVEYSFFVPKMCNHCNVPACTQVCPKSATFQTPDGAVLVDEDRCIGCLYCKQACPYGARYLRPIPARPDGVTRVAGKCTWCWHRLTQGLQPACVSVCPRNALIFGDLNDPNSDISLWIKQHGREILVLKAEMGTHPAVKYIGINEEVR
ncbi:MAG: 4Fe-4S dicluster domain-containing protein [Gammaproteobacteria bacterium]|nr:4Fe-4S dicluster domain-containing protein [Gammaproteobacteria bacterium]MDH5799397.1 4Fe-4S dicluster domain-containing protein [Gammaproteobacteria bacterium]